jgi:hypothetical protein
VYGGPLAADRKALHRAALETMAVELNSLACQESSLHGLGHWRSSFPMEVEAVIDQLIARHQHARPELLIYGSSARCGCVL